MLRRGKERVARALQPSTPSLPPYESESTGSSSSDIDDSAFDESTHNTLDTHRNPSPPSHLRPSFSPSFSPMSNSSANTPITPIYAPRPTHDITPTRAMLDDDAGVSEGGSVWQPTPPGARLYWTISPSPSPLAPASRRDRTPKPSVILSRGNRADEIARPSLR